MKKLFILIMVMAVLILVGGGCTKIVKLDPASGPAGQPVYISSSGMFGDPASSCLKWDGDVISDPCPGSFVVPADAKPGKHKVTLIDNLDDSEAFLIWPIFRLRQDSVTFVVIGQ